MTLASVQEIVDDIRLGKMVILMDDESRENEGDLIMPAQSVRPEDINFMATHARGLICLTLTEERCKQLGLGLMVSDNRAPHSTNFTVSIEAAEGVTTGISAADRARTIQAAVAKDAVAADIVQPGHIFPVVAQPGGVLSRAGHTEAGCDLARMAGMEPASVIVEIMNEDGSMARRADLEQFAKKHGLKVGTIADLIEHRSLTESTVRRIGSQQVNTRFGDFALHTYHDEVREEHHYALVKGEIKAGQPTLTRVHVGNLAKDLLMLDKNRDEQAPPSWTCYDALKRIHQSGAGVLVLICQSESMEDIEEQVEWLTEGKQLRPKPDVVYKQIGTGSQILRDLGVSQMRLMSAPFKFNALSGFNLEVIEFISNDLDAPTASANPSK